MDSTEKGVVLGRGNTEKEQYCKGVVQRRSSTGKRLYWKVAIVGMGGSGKGQYWEDILLKKKQYLGAVVLRRIILGLGNTGKSQ